MFSVCVLNVLRLCKHVTCVEQDIVDKNHIVYVCVCVCVCVYVCVCVMQRVTECMKGKKQRKER